VIPTGEIRPKSFWYGIGGGLIGLGVIAAAVVFAVAFREPFRRFQDLNDQIDAMERVSVPGEGRVNLAAPGDYFLYEEGASGDTAPFGNLSESAVTVESVEPDSTPLALRDVLFDESYDFGGPAGRSAFAFTVDEPGEYLVTVTDAPPDVSTVAVGPRLDLLGSIGSVFVAIFVPIGVGGVFVVAGGIVLIVTAVRRSGSARRLRMGASPTSGAWAPTSGTWPPQGAGGYPPPSQPPTGWPPPPTPPPPAPPPPPPPPP